MSPDLRARLLSNPEAAKQPGHVQDGLTYFGPKDGVVDPRTTDDLRASPQ